MCHRLSLTLAGKFAVPFFTEEVVFTRAFGAVNPLPVRLGEKAMLATSLASRSSFKLSFV